MYDVQQGIRNIDKTICDNIKILNITSRGLVSQNMLGQSRNLVEHVALMIYSETNTINDVYEGIKSALEFIKHRNEYLFLRKFHTFLQEVKSHYTPDNEGAERLMLKYYEYFLQIKNFLKDKYNIEVLHNIDKFPVDIDKTLQEYYEKIVDNLSELTKANKFDMGDERFYVQKSKPFFVAQRVYYEHTLMLANDSATKFDRFVVFSKFMIPSYYAIKVSLQEVEIEIANKKMPVKLLSDWRTSIRPCELKNFGRIFYKSIKISSKSKEYNAIMNYLSNSGESLVDIITSSEEDYKSFKQLTTGNSNEPGFVDILDSCRNIVKKELPGSNVLRYLLYTLKNTIIKSQLDWYGRGCSYLTMLNLKMGCIPFDKMPFSFSLCGHNPAISDVFGCINVEGREDELLERRINVNTSSKGQLYTKTEDIEEFGDVEALMAKYNDKLYSKHQGRRLEKFGKNVYIKEYEMQTKEIICKLVELTQNGIVGYKDSVEDWLEENPSTVDSEEKREVLKQMFERSKVSMIYGAAGTGKSTLINYISQFFDENEKIYLANTNPAIDNLQRKVKAQKCEFMTIAKFLNNMQVNPKCDILIIDECSMVSNRNMVEILEKAEFKLLVLVGDVYQIEAISFGNWFGLAREYVPDYAYFELETPYRAKENKELLELWKKVRNFDDDITEHMVNNRYSVSLDETIFQRSAEDEIILCLNYDGLYGINNINRFLQNSNQNKAYRWGVWTYKVGDPILFNETSRFTPVLYNNLKGKIVNIELDGNKIWFTVEIEKVLNAFNIEGTELQLLSPISRRKSVVRFFVEQSGNEDDEEANENVIVPFQIAYAVSIHKAQGLEYDSVKVVITEEIDEMITHNIFYTAITRAKDRLKVYWTPESQHRVIGNFERSNSANDAVIFSARTKIKRITKKK